MLYRLQRIFNSYSSHFATRRALSPNSEKLSGSDLPLAQSALQNRIQALSHRFHPRRAAVPVDRKPDPALLRPQRQFQGSRLPPLFEVPVNAARVLFEGVAQRDVQTALLQSFVDEALETFGVRAGRQRNFKIVHPLSKKGSRAPFKAERRGARLHSTNVFNGPAGSMTGSRTPNGTVTKNVPCAYGPTA